ncbi:MAG: PSD1 domain-containing protein [Planctomycetaceae bacterium]|nr:PSD1 domain-containing protein [Planctomycetaceae bacterium]
MGSRFGALLVVLSFAGLSPAEEPRLTFEDDVAPILEARCFKCHGEKEKKGNLDLRRRFAILKGGDSGAGIVPGKADESVLIERIKEGTMPPKEEGALDAKQLDVLVKWVAGGAPIKGKEETPLEVADGDESVKESDRQFWSFQPPKRAAVPTVQHADRVRTPIDAFLLARLEAKGLSFNADADKAVLLRRLCFDLHGLPPTREQLEAFLKDDRPDAYERLIDTLLDSPRYGERWGRHWLDVAGYADSDGYLEADRERPEAWRYRDYVIRALNADKPYDRFLIEQFAGDEMFDWRRASTLTPEMEDALVATGFLRTAADGTYPGYKEKTECYKTMADTVQIVSSAILGVTLQCARCHAHKQDPFTQRDYYQLHAVLLSSYDPDRWLASIERAIPLASEAQQAEINKHNVEVDGRIAALNKQMADWQSTHRQKLLAEKLAIAWSNVSDGFDAAEPSSQWSVKYDGTASGWKTRSENGALVIDDIAGKPGYAIVRLSRPTSIAGAFNAEFDFRWTSKDDGPATNTAMQVVILHFRDLNGNIVVSHGYVDENNNLRGSPIFGGPDAGKDVIAHYLAKHQQAVPPDQFARALAPSGAAKVKISRDAAGVIKSTFDDGVIHHEGTAASTARIAQIEIELRRYVLTPGATFEGLALDRLSVELGQGSVVPADVREKIAAALLIAPDKRNEEQKKLVSEHGPAVTIDDAELARQFKDYQSEIDRLKAAVAAETAQKKTITQLRGLLDLDGNPTQGKVLRRGDFNSFGANVEPGLPAVLVPAGYEYKPEPVYKSTGRRTAFAKWLVDPSNPLTARVHVNRVWAAHFGRGLVPTVDQFGHSGEKPSHPELLDWLACEFQGKESGDRSQETGEKTGSGLGWSQKALHRLILRSTVYRQTSDLDPKKAEADPGNVLLGAWPPRRHQGEVVRDSLLALSGKLNLEMFGKPVDVSRQGDGQVVVPDTPAGNRRSIYLKVRRSQPITLLELFDTPRMEVNCTQRTEAIVATQALTLSNSRFVETAADAFARRLLAAADENERITQAWLETYARNPTVRERAAVREFLNLASKGQPSRDAAWPHVAQALFNSNEFLFVH